MKYQSMGVFLGLESMPARTIGWWASSPAEMMRVLRAKKICASSGDTGSITVWRGLDGKLRGTFQRNYWTLSTFDGKTMKQLSVWVREWWGHLNAEITYTPVPYKATGKKGGKRCAPKT